MRWRDGRPARLAGCAWVGGEFASPELGSAPLARVAELADAPDLGSGTARCGGSSPSSCTTQPKAACARGVLRPSLRPAASAFGSSPSWWLRHQTAVVHYAA